MSFSHAYIEKCAQRLILGVPLLQVMCDCYCWQLLAANRMVTVWAWRFCFWLQSTQVIFHYRIGPFILAASFMIPMNQFFCFPIHIRTYVQIHKMAVKYLSKSISSKHIKWTKQLGISKSGIWDKLPDSSINWGEHPPKVYNKSANFWLDFFVHIVYLIS